MPCGGKCIELCQLQFLPCTTNSFLMESLQNRWRGRRRSTSADNAFIHLWILSYAKRILIRIFFLLHLWVLLPKQLLDTFRTTTVDIQIYILTPNLFHLDCQLVARGTDSLYGVWNTKLVLIQCVE